MGSIQICTQESWTHKETPGLHTYRGQIMWGVARRWTSARKERGLEETKLADALILDSTCQNCEKTHFCCYGSPTKLIKPMKLSRDIIILLALPFWLDGMEMTPPGQKLEAMCWKWQGYKLEGMPEGNHPTRNIHTAQSHGWKFLFYFILK